jgi:4-hydroxybenzoate polyprenyltransferase
MPLSIAFTPRHVACSLREIAGDIKLAHSVFALPFALLGAFMAWRPPTEVDATPLARAGAGSARFAGQLTLIVLAMVLARTAAMLANRLLDRRLDARNPRTAGRAIPAGRLSPAWALVALTASTAGFLAVCAGFGAIHGNWWPVILGGPVLAWLLVYPLLKRLTSLCHLYLGACLAISPLAAAIAIDPTAALRQPALALLGGMVLCWVAGFDINYALQDMAVDRAEGLHSIPARLGPARALQLARLLHAAAVACLIAVLALDSRFGAVFAFGIAIVTALLLYEHLTVARWGTTRMALAFFTLNGMVSCVLGALGIADMLV